MYITLDEFKIPDELRTRLTDNEQVGVEDSADIQDAINEAGAEINGYIGGRVDLTTITAPYSGTLQKYCQDISVYHLWGMRPMLPIPDQVQDRYDRAINFLRRYADDGKGSLGIEETPESGSGESIGSTPETEFSLNGY